ncbi:MAG: prolyl-tRNA synthetase associated domain-containing protein [Rhizobiaceae bacterium]
MPATPQQLFDLLQSLGIETETHQHEAVFTVEQSTALHQRIEGGHTKNLFVKDKKDNYFLIVAEGHARIPMNRIHPLVGASSRLSFANADRLMEFLGVEPGSVTAFSVMNDTHKRVRLFIDAPLLRHELINCHPLKNTMTTTISKADLLRFLSHVEHEPVVVQLSTVDGEDADAQIATAPDSAIQE